MKKHHLGVTTGLSALALALALPATVQASTDICAGVPAWDSNKVYAQKGTQVTFDNALFTNKWWTRNEQPNQNNNWGVWNHEGDCKDGGSNVAPTVSFTAPANNSSVELGSSVDFTVDANDSDGQISSTEFFVDNVKVTSPWTAASVGSVVVKVVVTDDKGATAEASLTLNVVDSQNTLPDVTLTEPTAGSKVKAGNTLTISANASDADAGDSISKVEFLVDGKVVATDSTAPYSAEWNASGVGAHSVSAKAYDSQNGMSETVAVSVEVTPAPVAPSVSITSPAAQSQFAEGAVVNITANATDSDGSVTQVEFFVDGLSVGIDSQAPYSASWSAIGQGSAVLTAVATDDTGLTANAGSVRIQVGDQNVVDHEACRPDGLVGDSVYCTLYDTDGREIMDSDHARRVIGYFTSWRHGHNNKPAYIAKDIPWDKITHINYAFAHINTQGEVSIGDPNDPNNAATGMTWPGVAGAEMDPEFSFKGHFNQLAKFKKQYPDVKTLISVGGWAETGGHFGGPNGERIADGGFYTMAETQAGIDKFADSAVEFIRKYQFDGVDIDYEYATSNNGAGNPLDEPFSKPRRATLFKQYVALMKTLREKLDIASKQDGKHYMLTIASPASGWLLRGQEFYQVTQYLDYVNIMSYDLHGAWNEHVGPNAALFDSGKDPELADVYSSAPFQKHGYLNTDWAYHYFRGSMPAGRINIGIPYYSRGWKDVKGGTNGLWGNSPLANQKECPMGTGTDRSRNPYAGDNTAKCGNAATGLDNVWHDAKPNGEEEPAGFNPMWHIMNLIDGRPGSYITDYGLTPDTDPDDTLQGTYTYHHDPVSVSSWIWNDTRKSFLSIESETSMSEKVKYVTQNEIGGVMFWELAGDYSWNAERGEYFMGDTLTTIAYNEFKAATPYGNKKAEFAMPQQVKDITVQMGGFKLGDQNYPLNPELVFTNNTGETLPQGALIEFDVATSTPSNVTDQSGAGLTVIKEGHTGSGNVGGIQGNFHRVQFPVKGWNGLAAGESIKVKMNYYLPISSPSNFTIEINGVKYGFTFENPNAANYCAKNPTDPQCVTPPDPNLCSTQKVDTSTIPTYPAFPNGQNHAKKGDRVKDSKSVFEANWWTTSTPVNGGAWKFVCNL